MGVFKNWIFESTTADSMLAQLADDFQARYEQPKEFNANNNSHTLLRLVTADALDDEDRTEESALLRDMSQHVVVVNGKVRRGAFFHRIAWRGTVVRSQYLRMRENHSSFLTFVRRVDADKTGDYIYYRGGFPMYDGNGGFYIAEIHGNGYRLFCYDYGGPAVLVHVEEREI